MNDLETLTALLFMPAVQRAALGLLLGAIALPLVGVIIVGLDIMPVRFAMMHVALLGIAIGLISGLDPTLCALVACAVAGAAVSPLADRPGGLSGGMGLLMSLAMAAALLLIALSGVNAASAFALLWGSILSVRTVDLVILGVLALLVPALFVVFRRQLALLLHDRELALVSGVPVRLFTVVLLVIVAVAVAGAIRLTGALLVDALTILPALAARRVGSSLGPIATWAIVFGLVSTFVGFALALLLDLPPGPVLVLVAGALTIAVHLLPERKTTWHHSEVVPPRSH